MKEYTLFYSVGNGGDGSAYPHFMESEELCEWDQEHMGDECWGESCTGSFALRSESDIFPVDDVKTKEAYFIDRYLDGLDEGDNDEAQEFIQKFFPNGWPTFTVTTEETGNPLYLYNNVFVGERLVAKKFLAIGGSGKAFEKLLNSISHG